MPEILPTPRAGSWLVTTGTERPDDDPPRAGSWLAGVSNPPDIRVGSWLVMTFTPPSTRRRPPMGILLTRRSREL